MPCGLPPSDCVTDHLAETLHLHPTGWTRQGAPREWGGPCPVCKRANKFSLGVGTKGPRFTWRCHYEPACTWAAIREAMLAIPQISELCLGRSSGKHRKSGADPDLAAVRELYEADWLSHAAMRIRLKALVDEMPPREAGAKLGYSVRTVQRALTEIPGRAKYQ